MSAPRIYLDRFPSFCQKNYRNMWKFDEVLTKTNLLSFFWDTVYIPVSGAVQIELFSLKCLALSFSGSLWAKPGCCGCPV